MTDTYNENNLEWPEFSGDNDILANVLRELGYEVEYRGRSGISARNRYIIETKDGNLTEDVLKQIEQDIEKAQEIIKDRENKVVDRLFDENKYDEEGVFSYVVLGGHPSNPTYYDTNKYERVYSERLAHKGHLREYNHTYGYCLYDKEKLKNSKNKIFVFKEALRREFCDVSERYGISFKAGNNETGFSYIVNGTYLEHSETFDIDLTNEDEVREAFERHNLDWPKINATENEKAEELKKMGYDVGYVGRSGFEYRNRYEIKTKDRVLTKDVLEKMKEDFVKVDEIISNKKFKAFDDCFNETSSDANKCYAVIETGGTYYRERVPSSRYKEIASIRVGCTQDYRRGVEHTYATLFFDEEKLKNDKRKCIKIYVPKDMIGMVIGKKGATIKQLQEKYGKFFKVEQEPLEAKLEKISAIKDKFSSLLEEKGVIGILEGMDLTLQNEKDLVEAEKEELREFFKNKLELYEKEQEEMKISQRKNDIISLRNNIEKSFGDKFVDMTRDEIDFNTNLYLEENADKIVVIPNDEELAIMIEDLQESSKYLKEVRIFEHNSLVEQYADNINSYVRNYEKENSKELSFEELKEFVEENFADEKARLEAYNNAVEIISKEREDKRRIDSADKKFDKVVDTEITRFLNSDFTEPHGESYFNSVGKDRRDKGYELITRQIFIRLGIKDLMQEETSWGKSNTKLFYDYKNKVIDRINNYTLDNETTAELYCVDIVDETYDEPKVLTEEEKEEVKNKLKEAKKAYRNENKMKKVEGGLEGLLSLMGGMDGI